MARSGFAKQHLRSFIERIQRLEEEKKAISDDIKEIYAEAKGTGFDTKIMRQVVRLLKMEKADRQEWFSLIDCYLTALESGSDVSPDVDARTERLAAANEKHDVEAAH